MNRLVFERGGRQKIIQVLESGERSVFDFLNAYSVFLYEKNELFRDSFEGCNYYNFPDGIVISAFHLLKHGSWLQRTTGPEFMEFFLGQKRFMKGKEHFFLGISAENLKSMCERFGLLEMKNIRYYNPPYINGMKFSGTETNKIIKLVNKENVDYLWLGLGNPKKEIITKDIYNKARFGFAFSVGAAFDFLSGAKKQAPKAVRTFGMEWLFRLMTDFAYSRNKAASSFKALSMLNKYVVFRD